MSALDKPRFTTSKKVLLGALVLCVLATLTMSVGVWTALSGSSSELNLTPVQTLFSWGFTVMSIIQFLMICVYSLYEYRSRIPTSKVVVLGLILVLSLLMLVGGILLTLIIIENQTKYVNLVRASLISTYILLALISLYSMNNVISKPLLPKSLLPKSLLSKFGKKNKGPSYVPLEEETGGVRIATDKARRQGIL